MSVELSYRVVHLARIGPSVKMILEEVRTVPPEEIERARLESEQEPETDIVVESEQFQKVDLSPPPEDPMRRMIWAWKQEFPEIEEIFKGGSFPGAKGGGLTLRSPVPISNQIEVLFTPEQYRELGSPPLLSTIQIALTVQ